MMINHASTPPSAAAPPLADRLAGLRRRGLAPLLAVLLGLHAILMAIWLALLTPMAMDLTYPEGSVVERALRAALNEPVYGDWLQWPHAFAPYGPLTYYPAGWMARLFGDPPDFTLLYLLGRLQSLAALAACILLLWLIGRRLGMGPPWRIAAIGLTMLWPPVWDYVISFRPDAPMTAFWLAAVLGMVAGPARGRRLALVLGALYLAAWVKPTAALFALAAGIWIVEGRGWRRAGAIMGGWGLAGLLPALALNFATDGMLLHNLIGGNGQGFLANAITGWMKDMIGPPLLLLGLGGVAAGWLATRPAHGPRWLGINSLAALVLALALGHKNGADINYFFPPLLPLSLCAVEAVRHVWAANLARPRPRREALLWFTMLPLLLLTTYYASQWPHKYRILAQAGPLSPQLLMMAPYEAPILSVLNYVSLNSDHRHPTLLDHFAFGALVRRGRLSPEPFHDRIRSQWFEAIHIYSDDIRDPHPDPSMQIYGEGFLPLLRQHYRLAADHGQFLVFEPRGRPARTRPTPPLPSPAPAD